MTALIGGIAALVLGIVGIIVFWKSFLMLLGGGIPLVLILGGALATYLGLEEFKDRVERKKEEEEGFTTTYGQPEDVEKYKSEAKKYEDEVQVLKKEIEELKGKAKE